MTQANAITTLKEVRAPFILLTAVAGTFLQMCDRTNVDDASLHTPGLRDPGQGGSAGAVPVMAEAGGPSVGGAAAGGAHSLGGHGGEALCVSSLPIRTEAPATLEETGFYKNAAAKRIADDMLPFEPRFQLWSDGAKKSRWLYLPECGAAIDASDMDNWRFPPGTYSFKQFVVDGVLVETRMIHRYGEGDGDWIYATYVWDESTGVSSLDNNGHSVTRAGGGTYEVPNVAAGHCSRCHGPTNTMSVGQFHGMPSRLLGPNAIDLSHGGPGLTLDGLLDEGLISRAPSTPVSVPGDAVTRRALGYLHANCGYCHNDTELGQPLETDYFLRLKASDGSVEETGVFITAVNQPVSGYVSLESNPCTHRIYGGTSHLSCIVERMGLRPLNQMPPLDTNRVDAEGIATLEAFVTSLAPPL